MRIKIVWQNGWAHVHGTGPDGKRIRRALKTRDPIQAAEACAQLEARIWKEGVYGAEAIITFDQAALAYAENGGETRYLLRVAEHFKGKLIRTITPNDVRNAAKKLYPNAKASTQNREAIAPASAVINFSHQNGWCGPIRVKRLREEKVRRVAVGFDYLDALQPALSRTPHLFAMLVFMHTTGRRIGEAVALLSEDCDFVTGEALIHDTKNEEPIRVALPEETLRLMAALPARRGRVFGYLTTYQPRNTLKRACARAGVPYLGTHQVGRHSFATHLKTGGMDSKTVADAGGWKTAKMVDSVYTHMTDASSRAAKAFDKKMTRHRNKGGNK